MPDSAFVMEPNGNSHDSFLFIHPRSPRDTDEFYKNARYGEFWVGRRMTLEETETKYQIKVKQIEDIENFLKDGKPTLIIRGEDSRLDSFIKASEKEDELKNV
ncbi:MAG: aminopeptidase P N-terminal domain-containing protein, partial [Candidatus Fonsibacter sp.]